MDSLITAAAQALAAGDPLGALNRVALRGDPPALALRGIAMAQLGELARAKALLRAAAHGFGPREAGARARCRVAAAEIALVSRDLSGMRMLGPARAALEAYGDRANAAHAAYLEARLLLLVGRLDEAERMLDGIDEAALPAASRTGYHLVAAGIAMRRVRAGPARAALEQAGQAAREVGIPALAAEVAQAAEALAAPVARLIAGGRTGLLDLADVEALSGPDLLLADACRRVVRAGNVTVPLAGRPVLFALLRALAEAWPGDVSREALLARAFRARDADETSRARLRVEIGRLRKLLEPSARVSATSRGFVLTLRSATRVAVLAPPSEQAHPEVLALLTDGEAWSSSALALALDVSPRTVQRALEGLAEAGQVRSLGRGRACRWTASSVPGFPTSLLLPTQIAR